MGIGSAIAGVIAAAVGITSQTAIAVIGYAINAAISIGLSLASQALAGKPRSAERPGRTSNVQSAVMAHQIVLGRVRKGGLLAYVNGEGSKNKWLHSIVVYAAHEVDAIESMYIGGRVIEVDPNDSGNALSPGNPDDTNYRDYVYLQPQLGSPSQTANAELVARTAGLVGPWTTDHRLRGRANIYGRFRESPARFGGIPNITAIIRGAKSIFDPRTSTTGWTDNPALQLAWFVQTYLRIPSARIDQPSLISAANVCDELVALKAGGTQKRYTSNGYIDLEGDPAEWIEPMVFAMAGAFVEHDGNYYIHAGHWVAPEVVITDADIINDGEIVLQTANSNIDRSNAIKGIFVSPDTFDAPTEFPMVSDANMIAEDGGAENVLDIDADLEFCDTHQQAQRVAKIMLRRQRHDITLTVDVHLLVGLDVKPWDNVTVDSDVLGISGVYQIKDHKLIIDENGPLAFVRLTLQEHPATVYDWDSATDEQDLTQSELELPHDDKTPVVQVKFPGDATAVPTPGVDNDVGNVGDMFIDLEQRKVVRKRGVFS